MEWERFHEITKNFVSDLYDYNYYTGKTKEEDIEEADNDDEESDDVVINLEDQGSLFELPWED